MTGHAWRLRAAVLLLIGLFVSPAMAVNPSLSGSLTVPFIFVPDDPETPGNQSYWYWSGGISGGISLSVPSVMEITTSVLGSGLDWTNNSIWNTFPLDSGGLFINASGSGTYNVSVNGGSPTLNVLGGGGGPTEGTVQTRVDFSNIHGSGSVDGFGSATILSNIVPTKYNVTIPAGAHVTGTNANVQNLTIHHNASLLMPTAGGGGGSFGFVRQNLANHGTAELNGEVQGNFINDALPANGDVATTPHLVLNGQLLNTGELRVTQYFKTVAATSNAGTMKINGGGTFLPQAAFANNGTFEFSSGALDGPGVVTNNGTFDWSGGNINGSVVNTTNSFTISGNGGRTLIGTLTNSGTIIVSGGGTFTLGGDGVLTNQAGGLFDIVDDNQMYDGGAVGTIDNAGTFRKSGGSGATVVGAAINNTGTITVTSGSLRFLQGGTLDGGTMSFANGGTVDLNNGSFFLQGSNSASGNGALVISSSGKGIVANGNSVGLTNFTGGADLILRGGGELRTDAGGTLTLNLTGTSEITLGGPSGTGGGRIGGAGTTINMGNFEWADGTVAGNLRNDSVNFTISSTESHTIEGGILTNTSTITHLDDATVYINSGGTLVNQAGALYDITGDGDITASAITDTVTNAGTFRKSGGSGTSVISAPLTNTGTLAIESGMMLFAGPNALVLDEAGTLAFKLSGNVEAIDFGKVDVSSELVADGTLEVSLEAGFAPGSGDSFNILDWQTICGTFDDVQLPSLDVNLEWDTSQLYLTGVLTVALPGDFNLDEKVDAADYVVWRKNDTANNPLPNDNGLATQTARFDLWRGHFGLSAGGGGEGSSAGGNGVPEPSAMLLAVVGLLAISFERRRR